MCFDVLRQSHQENQIRQTLTAIEKTKVSERMSCEEFPKMVYNLGYDGTLRFLLSEPACLTISAFLKTIFLFSRSFFSKTLSLCSTLLPKFSLMLNRDLRVCSYITKRQDFLPNIRIMINNGKKLYVRKKEKKIRPKLPMTAPKIYSLFLTWKIYALMRTSFDFDM